MAKEVSSLKVLYVHGLEGGPGTYKPNVLAEQFEEVRVPFMPIKRIIKRAKKTLVAIGLTSLGSSGCFCYFRSLRLKTSLFLFSSVFVSLYFIYKYLKRKTVRNMFSKCIEIQKAEIKDFQPDVVVASSWGGAVAVGCIAQGFWRGPTILLAPAVSAVAKAMDQQEIRLPSNTTKAQSITIFHGDKDTVIPLSGSKSFVQTNPVVNLVVCPGEDHSMHKTATNKLTKEIIRLYKETQ